MNKITCVCLGTRNMEKALKFYRDDLGFKTETTESNPPVCFFNTPGTKFEIFPINDLAKDIFGEEIPVTQGFPGFTLAYNVASVEEVQEVMALVKKAGGKIVKEPQETFWGGYHAYFADLDGYYWEVVYAPMFKLDKDGLLEF